MNSSIVGSYGEREIEKQLPVKSGVGKNSGSGRFKYGQIGHLDKNFIPRPCSDYKSDTLTRPIPGPGPECQMSGPGCPNVRICNMILGHSDQNFV